MRLLTNLLLFACAASSLAGCCHRHRHHSCLFGDRYRGCVDRCDHDDDDWEDDCCNPCGSCGCQSQHFGDYGTPWTSDCGCSTPMPAYNSYPAAPMTYGAPSGGCNCESQATPTFQQPVYMQAPTSEPVPTPTMPETYYNPRPGSNAPSVPPATTVPTRFPG